MIAIGVLAILVISAAGLWTGIHNIAPRTSLSDLVSLGRPVDMNDPLAARIRHDERINILLMARGGAGSDNPNFTDTMLILSIRPRSGESALVSLPRFLLVDIPATPGRDVPGRLYSAFALGAKPDNPNLRSSWKTATGPGDLAAATVAEVTHLPIDYWIAIDIRGFRTIIDAMDGIDVTVPATLDDPSYPVDETERRIHIHFNAGRQRMDGERALQYARSRLSSSEADRSARQELVMVGILQKLRALKPGTRLISLLGALQDRLLTNLRPNEMRQLFDAQRQLPLSEIHRVTVDSTNFVDERPIPGGGEVEMPRDGNFAALQHYLAFALPDRQLVAAQVPVTIFDGNDDYHLPANQTPAQVEVDLLHRLGWNVSLGPSRASLRLARTRLRVGDITPVVNTGQWMAAYFADPAVSDASLARAVEITLGSDFTRRIFPTGAGSAVIRGSGPLS